MGLVWEREGTESEVNITMYYVLGLHVELFFGSAGARCGNIENHALSPPTENSRIHPCIHFKFVQQTAENSEVPIIEPPRVPSLLMF